MLEDIKPCRDTKHTEGGNVSLHTGLFVFQLNQIILSMSRRCFYLGAPQLDSPVEGRGDKQVGEVQRPCSCVAVDPCDGPLVALKHLADARFAAEHRQD